MPCSHQTPGSRWRMLKTRVHHLEVQHPVDLPSQHCLCSRDNVERNIGKGYKLLVRGMNSELESW